MAYSIIRINKIKSSGIMYARFNHNRRREQPPNVDPTRTCENESLISLPWKDGKELSYWDAWKLRMEQVPYYETHKCRKNAVLAIEVVCSYSSEADIDVDAWKALTVDWLTRQFNVAPDGHSNILNAEFHADEARGPHIHAIVVPVNQNGRLSYSSLVPFPNGLSDLYTSYADAVAPLGLERGVKGSFAKYTDIHKMYAALSQDKADIPAQEPGESAADFLARANDYLETKALVRYREASQYQQRLIQQYARYKNETRAAMLAEVEQTRKKGMEEVERLKQETLRERESLISQQQEVAQLKAQLQETMRAQQELRLALENQLGR